MSHQHIQYYIIIELNIHIVFLNCFTHSIYKYTVEYNIIQYYVDTHVIR